MKITDLILAIAALVSLAVLVISAILPDDPEPPSE